MPLDGDLAFRKARGLTSALHVGFNTSGAGCLRKTLARLGHNDEVVALIDDLSFGPIDPPDPDVRAQWVEKELGYGNWNELNTEISTFWHAALSDTRRRIVWMSRRSAQEYAGFLEFVGRLGDAPCEIIDLTEVSIIAKRVGDDRPKARPVVSLGGFLPEEIIGNNLLDRAVNFTEEMRESYRAKWETLRGENAALRVVDKKLALRSAPISHFDQLLLSYARRRWLKAARIVGKALTEIWDDNLFVGSLVLASRLAALVEAGLLESQGDISQLTRSEVRLPTARAAQY